MPWGDSQRPENIMAREAKASEQAGGVSESEEVLEAEVSDDDFVLASPRGARKPAVATKRKQRRISSTSSSSGSQ